MFMMIAANVPVADFLLGRMFLTRNVLRFSGWVAGCCVSRIYAIYVGWRNAITLLVAALDEFVVPAGGGIGAGPRGDQRQRSGDYRG